jgi:hypothetical protein
MTLRQSWLLVQPFAAIGCKRRTLSPTGRRSSINHGKAPGPMVGILAIAGLLLAGCGQADNAATVATTAYTSVATVDSGAECIPDLNTTHLSLVPLQPGGATGEVPSNADPQQVRDGAVPAPPNAQLVTQGRVVPQPTAAGDASTSVLRPATLFLYETGCGPVDVQAYYVAALLQNQWAGSFVPASGAQPSTASASASRSSAAVGGDTTVTRFDLATLRSGRFVNVHPQGDTVVFVEVLAAVVAPGTPQERHPTYVQLIVQPSGSTAETPLLPPSVVTTPNVGASAAPPGGGNAP